MWQTVFLRIKLFGLCVFLISCNSGKKPLNLPFYNTAEFNPLFLDSKEEVTEKVTHIISSFSFVSQNLETITQKNIEGKIHVANFIFTSCDNICPAMTEEMARVAKTFQNDSSVVILSYSVTPWIDTPERLKLYKESKGIKKSNWYFLTGNKSEIYNLARRSYFAEESLGFTKDSTQFLHTEHFLLVDGSSRIRGIYNGTLQLEAEQLIKDINTLKAERLD
jgi:protein SCO1/2